MSRKWYNETDLKDRMSQCYDNLNLNIDYINDNKQLEKARENNNNLHKTADFCKIVLQQMNDIKHELIRQRIIADIEYSKGYFRITRGDKVSYKKFDKTQWELQRSH